MLKYDSPELEVLRFRVEDILTSSTEVGDNIGEGDDDDATIGDPGDDWFTP